MFLTHPCRLYCAKELLEINPAHDAALDTGGNGIPKKKKKKKYCNGLVPVRTFCPPLTNATSITADFSNNMHLMGDLERVTLGRTLPRSSKSLS